MEWIAVWAGLLVGVAQRSVDLQFQRYRRQFVRPLQTAHGPWRDRQGLILQLKMPSGETSYGEIAPIPGFGTETLKEAIAFLNSLQADGGNLTLADLSAIVERSPAHYSATRFGLGMAIAQLRGDFPPGLTEPKPQQICALLPAGAAALEVWPQLWEQGHRTFKWKLGMADVAQELAELERLRRALPPGVQLRLDANGGLSLAAAEQCLNRCDDLADQGLAIEFLEQPLPPEQFERLLKLSQTSRTPLALDESVTGLAQLKDCHMRGWRGIFVLKGAIAGNPLAVLDYCDKHQLKVVFSSVFETGLARQAVFNLAQALQVNPQIRQTPQPILQNHFCKQNYALGFGVGHWLKPDGLDGQDQPTDLKLRGATLWQQLMDQ